jgi:hypothetical protein
LPAVDPLPVGDYFVFIARADKRPMCSVLGWLLRDLLPKVPIPLQAPDNDIVVKLGELFRQTYARGCYERSIDYRLDPPISLSDADQQWVAKQVATAHNTPS